MNAQQIIKYHEAAGAGGMLLVDDIEGVAGSGIAKLSEIGGNVNALWADDHFLRSAKTVVISKSRPARELYRVLSLIERFVSPNGTIVVLPVDGPDTRFEATELFLGVTPGWTRNLLASTVELRRNFVPQPGYLAGLRQGADGYVEITPRVVAHRRVVGLALFGEGGFWQSVGSYIRAHHTLFKGYELYIHHDDSIDKMEYGKVLRKLDEWKLIRLVHVAPDGLAIGKCRSMLWRFTPAWDPAVEYVFSRDLDSLPMWKERCAVEEFIKTGQDLNTIHNADAHCGVMGGLCGFRAAALRAFAPTFEAFVEAAGFTAEQWAKHGADQNYLNGAVRPFMTTFGHSIDVRHHRSAAMGSIRYVTEIATPSPEVVDSVPAEVRAKADTLANYMGAAGYPVDAAVEFYDRYCPVIDVIKEAERCQ